MTPALNAHSGPAGKSPAHRGAKAVEGKITSTDGVGKSVTLEDGTQLTIPDSLEAARNSLQEGAFVKATYEERERKDRDLDRSAAGGQEAEALMSRRRS
jgi:hypothetical protein